MTQTPEFGLGDRMRKARELAALDQAEMATRLGVSRALVSMWERGLSDPRTHQLERWAEETQVELWWFLNLAPASKVSGATGVSRILAGQAA